MKFKINYQKILVFLLLCLGFLFIVLQDSYIGMYFDDYGNASLSYGTVVPNVAGTNYKLSQILMWAKNTYFNWSGRILYAGFFLIPLLKKGAEAYMFVQSIITILICILSYKIICHYTDKKFALPVILLLYVLYGLIGQDVHIHGTYWASASVLYLWPLLPFFLAVFLYIKACDRIKKKEKALPLWLIPIITVILFFATFSQEQVGLSVILFFVLYICFDHFKEWKKYIKLDTLVLSVSLVSYCFLFFAPGNFVRLEGNVEFSNLNFIEKITLNMPKVLSIFFFNSMIIFNLLLILAMIIMTRYLINRGKRYNFTGITTTIITLVYGGLLLNLLNLPQFLLGCFYMGFLMNFVILSICYFHQSQRLEINALILSGGASVFCLLYSPSIQQRSYIEYIFILFIIISIIFMDTVKRNSKNNLKKVIMLIALLFLGYISFINTKTIFNAYEQNSIYLKYNSQKLLNYEKNSDNIIYLAVLPNKGYHSVMPYEPGSQYIENWMKEYYNIPKEVTFEWKEMNNVK